MSLLLACVYQSGGERGHTAGFRTHTNVPMHPWNLFTNLLEMTSVKKGQKKNLADQKGSSLIAAESFKSLAAYYSIFFQPSYLTNGSFVIS